MDVESFNNELQSKGGYQTDTSLRYSLTDRLLGPTSFWFYLKLAKVIRAGHHSYCRNELSLEAWSYYSHAILNAAEICGGRINILGLENLKKGKPPFVYIANHMSLIETMFLPTILLPFSDIAIVLKESLLKYPYFNSFIRAIDPICVTRTNPKNDLKCVMEKGAEAIRKGRSVLIFPQATRSADVNPSDFNTLGIKLACRAGALAVPIALKTDFLAPGRIVRDIGTLDRKKTIYFKFGSPVSVTNENSKQIHADIIEFITSSLKEWRAMEPQ